MANPLIVTVDELSLYGLSMDFLAQFDGDALAAQLQAATDEAMGLIYPAYTAPLVSWGADLRAAVARVAVYELKSVAGLAPTASAVGDENLLVRATAAREWLTKVGRGEIVLQGCVDSSSRPGDGILVDIMSDEPAGW